MPHRFVLSSESQVTMRAAFVVALIATFSSLAHAADTVKVPPLVNENRVDENRVEDSRWTRTLERIASGVVTIQIDQTRAFDTEWNSSGQATGFVVDAKRGLILTNRHVVTPGPVTAQAVFQNREEVALLPVYRDPVHDFGIYRYDPSKLRFIKPAELPLYPQGAIIGREVRVVGNDAGEQLSILAGTLARLDREAPNYGTGKYNDFNTFYYQAASSTSGGSSGSPVIDIEGRVLALNAGGSTGAASSFYLPLNRVVRALRLLQDDKHVARGSLQTVFSYTPYDELTRLGLDTPTEAQVRQRFPNQTGMLVVSEVQPGSAAENVLQPGDILVRINGELVTTFEPLDQVLDDSVGRKIKLELRRGRQTRTAELLVEDLYQTTPDRFFEFGDAVVHNLSWQQARHFNKPVSGVYIANPGYVFASAGVPRGAVITELNAAKTDDLKEFTAAVAKLKDGESATLRFFTLDDPRNTRLAVMQMDRRWYPSRECRRDDTQGVWPCTEWPADGVAEPPAPMSTQFAKSPNSIVNRVAPSLVLVHFNIPYSVSGYTDRSFYGTGLVVDAQRGLVVVDRNTVPVPLGDVRLVFAGSVEVPGRVEYIHPLHNLSVVSYDPRLLGTTPVRAAKLSDREVRSGESLWVVGLGPDSKIQSQSATVATLDAIAFPLSRTLRFRESNLEVVNLVNGPDSFDGVLVNKKGEILATWSSFIVEAGREASQTMHGIPAELIAEMLPRVRADLPLHSLEAELSPISLAEARRIGLPARWLKTMEMHDPERRQILGVSRLVAGSPAAQLLRSGDLILAIDGKPVSRFRQIEQAVQKDSVSVTILRNGAEQTLDIDTVSLGGHDVERIILWAGAVLQAPYRAMAVQRDTPAEGVYVAYFAYGTPASRYQLWAGRRIMEVDDQQTPDLDAFVRAVSGREDRTSLRLRTVTLNGATEVITVKLDKRYWPAYELRRTDQGWQRTALN